MNKQKKNKDNKTPVKSNKSANTHPQNSSPVCYANTDEVREEYK
ncbi:hypothetical protein [Fulvivirga ulvae]|nr:hypothetical protein [Fulvivirga ulvae]